MFSIYVKRNSILEVFVAMDYVKDFAIKFNFFNFLKPPLLCLLTTYFKQNYETLKSKASQEIGYYYHINLTFPKIKVPLVRPPFHIKKDRRLKSIQHHSFMEL